jgi:hypothetical protein
MKQVLRLPPITGSPRTREDATVPAVRGSTRSALLALALSLSVAAALAATGGTGARPDDGSGLVGWWVTVGLSLPLVIVLLRIPPALVRLVAPALPVALVAVLTPTLLAVAGAGGVAVGAGAARLILGGSGLEAAAFRQLGINGALGLPVAIAVVLLGSAVLALMRRWGG